MQHPVDAAGHAFEAATDIDRRALGQPFAQRRGGFAQALLDIDLGGLVAGKGQVQARQVAAGQPALQFVVWRVP